MKLLIAVSLLYFCGSIQSEESSVVLDPAENFNVSWSFDEINYSEITFTVTCKTTGWVGIGLSPKGGMAGADIIVGWVDSNGKGYIKDMHATDNGLPLVDDSQDVTLISSLEQDGVTTISFKRMINTCDVEDSAIQMSTTRLIYAYGSADPADNVLTSSDYHQPTKRGVRSLLLLEPQRQVVPTPDDALHFDMNMDSYHLSANDTTYYCAFFNPPALDVKHHVIAVEPLVTKGNEGLVHHILVYACWGVPHERIRDNKKTQAECHSAEMPEFADSCRSVVFSWAIGGTTFYYPEDAGFPIGATDGSSPQYFLMEIHYDNPRELDTWVDSSGLRLIYSPTLRKQDVGTVQIGTVFGLAVPPKPDKFRTVAYCDGSCTNQWIPDEGVEVFGYLLHTHLLGTSIQIDWFRNGSAMGVFASDHAFDFNFQENRIFAKNKKLLPGDTLKITCTYSDETRDSVTYGGLSTRDEMCLAFLNYYPRQNVSNCESFPEFTIYFNDPVYTSMALKPSRTAFGLVDLKVLDTVPDWSEDKVKVLQKAYEFSDHESVCYESSSEPFKVNSQIIVSTSYPALKNEEVEESKTYCTNSASKAQAVSLQALLAGLY